MNDILLAKADDEILSCYDVMVQLRPTYNHDKFLLQVKKQMLDNYQLVYLKSNNIICAVAGFRYSENLAWGKFLYVDDLVTASTQRSKGYGKLLLDWLIEQAKLNNCVALHLDSGIQRTDAHRFYKRENMAHTGYHFAIELD